MKKLFKLLSIAYLIVLCASCDPSHSETFYVENKYNDTIGLTFLHYNDSIIISPNQRVVINSYSGMSYPILSSVINNYEEEQSDNTYIDNMTSHSTIYFNDSIMINYQKDDTFKKNICYINSWTVLKNEDKRKGRTIEILYTITEEDYQNALNKH